MIEPGQLLKLRDASGRDVFVYADFIVGAYELLPAEGEAVFTLQLDRMLEGYGLSYVLCDGVSGERLRRLLDEAADDLTEPDEGMLQRSLGGFEG